MTNRYIHTTLAHFIILLWYISTTLHFHHHHTPNSPSLNTYIHICTALHDNIHTLHKYTWLHSTTPKTPTYIHLHPHKHPQLHPTPHTHIPHKLQPPPQTCTSHFRKLTQNVLHRCTLTLSNRQIEFYQSSVQIFLNGWYSYSLTNRKTDEQTDRQTDLLSRQTDRPTDGQTDIIKKEAGVPTETTCYKILTSASILILKYSKHGQGHYKTGQYWIQ